MIRAALGYSGRLVADAQMLDLHQSPICLILPARHYAACQILTRQMPLPLRLKPLEALLLRQ